MGPWEVDVGGVHSVFEVHESCIWTCVEADLTIPSVPALHEPILAETGQKQENRRAPVQGALCDVSDDMI